MPNKLNLKTQRGILGGFRGSQIKKSGEAGPIGPKFGTRLRIRLGMDIG